ncbi:hypothetical protein, partial [Levyella massiliensis]|uniref:hypothetical protein n=1 Tax=Levyella massiliensis TaxID=938289 RepID=UPI00399BEF93
MKFQTTTKYIKETNGSPIMGPVSRPSRAWYKDYGCLIEHLTKILFIKGLVTSLILGVTIPCLTPILPKGTVNFSAHITFSTVPNR